MTIARAQTAMSSEAVVQALIGTIDLGEERAICIGTAAECAVASAGVDMLVGFDFDSDILTDAARRNLDVFSTAMNDSRLQSVVYRIEGHTDAVGAPDYNEELSVRRADAVREFLASAGVDVSRMVVEGFGATHPRTEDPMDAENRRVELRAVLR